MSGTLEQHSQLAVLDRLAVLTEIDGLLQAVITRLANRARTNDEGDDVRLLIECRGAIVRYRALVAQSHKDRRDTLQGLAAQLDGQPSPILKG